MEVDDYPSDSDYYSSCYEVSKKKVDYRHVPEDAPIGVLEGPQADGKDVHKGC